MLLFGGSKGSHCFELKMTSSRGSSIKVTHHCLLMDDKVWINTQTSPLSPTTMLQKIQITPSNTEETYSSASLQTKVAMVFKFSVGLLHIMQH